MYDQQVSPEERRHEANHFNASKVLGPGLAISLEVRCSTGDAAATAAGPIGFAYLGCVICGTAVFIPG